MDLSSPPGAEQTLSVPLSQLGRLFTLYAPGSEIAPTERREEMVSKGSERVEERLGVTEGGAG